MYGSHPPTRADVLGLGKQGGSCTFSTPPAILVQFGAIILSTSPILLVAQIVCYGGFDKTKFADLEQTKLPEDRRDSCARDYRQAVDSTQSGVAGTQLSHAVTSFATTEQGGKR
jgi:hypothetical protein